MPVLVLVGTLDLRTSRSTPTSWPTECTDGRLVVLEGVAHLPHLESDPTCLRAIADFLGEQDRPVVELVTAVVAHRSSTVGTGFVQRVHLDPSQCSRSTRTLPSLA